MNGLKVLLVALSVLLAGCDMDPFGFDRKALTGPFYLEHFIENGNYYIIKKGDNSVCGVTGGGVTKLGWNQSVILAYSISAYKGDPDGWFVIDVKTTKVTGPLTDAQIAGRSDLSGVVPIPSDKAFKK